MKLILASDFQAEFSNLSYCEIAIEEIKASAKTFGPDAIIFAGDQKEAYNPADLRVVQFWHRAIRDLAEKWRVIMMLGNHDRFSQSKESKNWLNILRPAGCEIVTQPRIKQIGDGAVAFLPFTSSRKQEQEWAAQLALEMEAHSNNRALIFHSDVVGANLNSAGIKASGVEADVLHLNQYDASFGGHLHGYQKIEGAKNSYYIGSPFVHSWDEVNQCKGHLRVEITSKKVNVRQVRTAIPGWYDASFLDERRKNCKRCGGSGMVDIAYVASDNGIENEGETAPCECMPEAGALIRSRVPVTTKKITEQLRQEDDRLHKEYEGVRTLVIPKLIAEKAEIDLSGATDKERVEQYVAATMPEAARFKAERAVAYLTKALSTIAQGRSVGALRYIRLTGENCLAFRKIDIRYDKQGLVLLKGVNRDWKENGNRSNGAGKTSLLSLLPLAMFGRTTKGQKADSWAREHTKRAANLRLVMRDDRGRKIEIIRGRRPAKIEMRIDGTDVSTGIRGVGKNETQGQIEKETGFTLQMLMNSVYIDQTIANGFLFGTQKDKMDLIGKLQDLSRYEMAANAVKADIGELSELSGQLTSKVEALRTEIGVLRDDIKEYKIELTDASVWLKETKAAEKEVKAALLAYQAIKGSESFYEELQKEADNLALEISHMSEVYNGHVLRADKLEIEYDRVKKLVESGKCSKCGQKVDETQYPLAKLKKDIAHWRELEKTVAASGEKLEDAQTEKNEQIAKFEKELEEKERDLAKAREKLAYAQTGEERERERRESIEKKRKRIQTRLTEAKEELIQTEKDLNKTDVKLELRYYAMKALHRSGMPLYLCSTLCDFLNRSAEEYSEIFWGGRIKLVFAIEDGELTANVVNPAGSKRTEGQSVGEAAMAGLITAFALREAGPRTNLLFIDEPGSGLDETGQKQLAAGLLKLEESGRFMTILTTTHSPIISGLLEGKKTWRIVKKNRRSRLIIN
jgi:DNA repair exonuclease SbcCD ATPase subunit/Icc-related predicted phosphoesterase